MTFNIETVLLLLIAVSQAFNGFFAWRTKMAAEKTEVNTNHMREQLVEATGKVEHARGLATGRAEGRKSK